MTGHGRAVAVGGRTAPAATGRVPDACRGRPARAARVLAGVPVLALLLAGCGVETVEGEIADQQLCVAAQPLVEAVGARSSELGGSSSALPDAAALADRAVDAELRSALTGLGAASADAAGDAAGSAAWGEADRAVTTLSRVCQRLAAF